MVNQWLRPLCHSLTHLIFPSKCYHCQHLLPPDSTVLCSSCASLLDLLPVTNRCRTCFSELFNDISQLCHACILSTSPFYKVASAFDFQGPPSTLVKKLKYGNGSHLAKGMGAFLFAQFNCLGWPKPHVIIPVPITFTHWLDRGYNQSALLGKELGLYLESPVWDCLKRKCGSYPQTALPLEERKNLESSQFSFRCKKKLQGKVILIIDDIKMTGATLNCCGEILKKENPAALYALTFCQVDFPLNKGNFEVGRSSRDLPNVFTPSIDKYNLVQA